MAGSEPPPEPRFRYFRIHEPLVQVNPYVISFALTPDTHQPTGFFNPLRVPREHVVSWTLQDDSPPSVPSAGAGGS